MRYVVAFEEAWAPALAVREAGPAAAPKPRLLDRVREAIRTRGVAQAVGFSGHPPLRGQTDRPTSASSPT